MTERAAMERAPLTETLTPMQYVVVTLLALNYTHQQIAEELRISRSTVRYHLYLAVAKMPGDLPAEQRAVAWARGASVDVLEGNTLKLEIIDRSSHWTDNYSRRAHTVTGA